MRVSVFDPISLLNGWFTSQIWYDDFILRKFIQIPDFPDFSRIFVDVFKSLFSESWWSASPIWSDYLLFRNLSRCLDVSGIFSVFLLIWRFQLSIWIYFTLLTKYLGINDFLISFYFSSSFISWLLLDGGKTRIGRGNDFSCLFFNANSDSFGFGAETSQALS